MTTSTPTQRARIAAGHIDDPGSMTAVFAALQEIHGPDYSFFVQHWRGETTLSVSPGRHLFCFIVRAQNARIALQAGDRIRGVPPTEAYQRLDDQWGEAVAATEHELWPGDVVGLDGTQAGTVTIHGTATVFQIETEATNYPLPTAAFLRHLTDRPGGCAAYPGAFRREALPPDRTGKDNLDRRHTNRVNEHTLDMRSDRIPKPEAHHHGPVSIAGGQTVNHSETAIVLPRDVYGLPPMKDEPEEYVIMFPNATGAPTESTRIVLRPGSIVVTPATPESTAGHRFANAFAMLVAIPGFVSPHHAISRKHDDTEPPFAIG